MQSQKANTTTTAEKVQTVNLDPARGLVVSDGTNNRVLIGFDKNGFGDGKDLGIKVSKVGTDVFTATDSQIIMSSAFNMFKIVSTGTITIPALSAASNSSDTQTVEVQHGLGYAPIAIAWGTYDGNIYPFNFTTMELAYNESDLGGRTIQVPIGRTKMFTNSTKLSFTHFLSNPTASTKTLDPIDVTYYILQQTADA